MKNRAVIIMGVAGSGKTTIGKLLAECLELPFYDGDAFHPESNIQKMRQGLPLNDQDRYPWLQSLAKLVAQSLSKGGCVIACSALKEQYRLILKGNNENVLFVFLKGSRELIYSRMVTRNDHFMPPGLLESQFETLEEPMDAIVVSIEENPQQICASIIRLLENRA
ncbi:MAG: gluconokinase [Fibrobacter sp.]|nr:gluconokinase [Fibrobacter sp.]